MSTRKIIHIDMDAFYASIEQRDNPELRGRPVAVGHPGARGVVATASYEARRYGVRSALSSIKAMRLCPSLIFVSPRFDVYKHVSEQIHDIFNDYTDLVEPLSLDEAFLDVTHTKGGAPSATLIAREIKERIYDTTGLTASAGVSVNKFLAKIASDYNKPDGMFVITPEQAADFVAGLEIERFFGIGPVTAGKMHLMGIRNGADLRRMTEPELVAAFGKAGHSYYRYARGIDNRPVEPERIRKSVGAENTFADDIHTLDDLKRELALIREEVIRRMSRASFAGRTVTIKVKYADFRQMTRSRTLTHDADAESLTAASEELLMSVDMSDKPIRLLGLSVSNNDTYSIRPFEQRLPFKEYE